jgi:hypothetical protein
MGSADGTATRRRRSPRIYVPSAAAFRECLSGGRRPHRRPGAKPFHCGTSRGGTGAKWSGVDHVVIPVVARRPSWRAHEILDQGDLLAPGERIPEGPRAQPLERDRAAVAAAGFQMLGQSPQPMCPRGEEGTERHAHIRGATGVSLTAGGCQRVHGSTEIRASPGMGAALGPLPREACPRGYAPAERRPGGTAHKFTVAHPIRAWGAQGSQGVGCGDR